MLRSRRCISHVEGRLGLRLRAIAALRRDPEKPILWRGAPAPSSPSWREQSRCFASSSRRPRAHPFTQFEQEEDHGDILDDYPEETRATEHDTMEGKGYDGDGDGENDELDRNNLARKMWIAARRGVRSEEVWARYTQRVLMTGALLGPRDVTLIFLSYARIKYRDVKVLNFLSPFVLTQLHHFSTFELVLLLNAHKKLEYERIDTIKVLLGVICDRYTEWNAKHIALTANAVAHFYIYQPAFWKRVSIMLPKTVWHMNALELSNLVSAMARVDNRHGRSLLLLSRMSRRCAENNLFSQETLAVAINSFAKLDFNDTRLAVAFEKAAMVKLDRALELGQDYRKSSLKEIDVFDVQALVLVLQSFVCFTNGSDEAVKKLLTLIAWSKNELSPFQRRTLKTTCVLLRRERPALCRMLPHDVRRTMQNLEEDTPEVPTNVSRWQRELKTTLLRMDISVELKAVVDDQILDIYLPSSNAVVYAAGPFAHYINSTNRTAYSKLHQRLLEADGYTCLVVPYYEWSELKTEEDKMVYLWSLGRRAAGQSKDERIEDAMPASDIQTSDMSDMEESPRRR